MCRPAGAEAAVSAGTRGRDRDQVSRREPLDPGAHRGDMAGDFVPEDHRLPEDHRAEAPVVVVVEVGSADAARGDPDLHLPGTRGAFFPLLDSQVAGLVKDDGLQESLLEVGLMKSALRRKLLAAATGLIHGFRDKEEAAERNGNIGLRGQPGADSRLEKSIPSAMRVADNE